MRSRRFLIVAVLLLIAVISNIRASIAPADGAQPPNVGIVTVTDSAITPSSVTILAGGSVLWTNHGSRPHKIVSYRDAFKAFELAPAHLHNVPFPRPGVYPYTVDAATKGVVVVIAGSAYVPPTAASSTGPENCGHPKIYHYDIELVVHRDETGAIAPPAENAGPGVNKVFDWHAKWSHAPMSVELCRGKVRILLPPGTSTSYGADEGLAADESTFKIAWDDKSELIDYPSTHVPLCHFTEYSGSPAKLALDGGQFQFTFRAYRVKTQAYPILGPGGYVDKNCDHRRAVSGPGAPGPAMVDSTLPPFHTIDGFDWSLGDDHLNLRVSSQHAPMPFPVNALARGKGFDFRTGPLQTEIRTPGRSDAASDWATVSFTPVRP